MNFSVVPIQCRWKDRKSEGWGAQNRLFFEEKVILLVKFSFSEKATKICVIFLMGLTFTYLGNVKTMRKIAQIFVAFSKKLNFTVKTWGGHRPGPLPPGSAGPAIHMSLQFCGQNSAMC